MQSNEKQFTNPPQFAKDTEIYGEGRKFHFERGLSSRDPGTTLHLAGRDDLEVKGTGFLPRLYCWRRGCGENWTRVPLASKSRRRWNRWANNAGPVGSVHRRSRTRKRSIGPTPCHPRIPWVMSRTDPPTRSYPPLFLEVPVAFGTIRCRNPCAIKLNVSTGPIHNRLWIANFPCLVHPLFSPFFSFILMLLRVRSLC